LESSLERHAKVTAVVDLERCEIDALADFERLCSHEDIHPPLFDDWMSRFAFMQHSGGPTRLLDFTDSIEVAAHFALNDGTVGQSSREYAAIWAVNTGVLRGMIGDQLTLPSGERLRFDNDWIGGGLFNLLYNRTSVNGKGVAVARAGVSNPPLDAQRGLFLYALNLSHSFEENLYAVYSLPADAATKHLAVGFWDGIAADHIIPALQRSPVIKLLLPTSCHSECRSTLLARGVTRQSLCLGRG